VAAPPPAAPLPAVLPGHDIYPRRQRFSLAHVRLFVTSLLHLPASLRASAAVLRLLAAEGLVPSGDWKAPTAAGGRWWLLRIGLHEIQRPKQQAEDWVWIIDHTIQLGTTRVLLIVGLRLSEWEARGRGVLQHQDLQIMLLQPVQQSNAQIVAKQLEQVARDSGAPRAILSDQCRELGNAVELFQADHPGTLRLNDIKHRLALLLERQLKPDPRWSEFLQACQQMRKKSQQTTLAFLMPPTTKEKARFMNLGEMIRWATSTLRFLEQPQMPPGITLDQERLESVFGGLPQYAAAIGEWQSLIDLIDTTMARVREQGYDPDCADDLRRQLTPLARHDAAQCFVQEILEFVQQQTATFAPGEHLPGSSEVIESLIGKGKRLEGQQSKNGFTKMVLGLAAAVVPLTNDHLRQALETIGTKHVARWAKENLGPSLQGLRQQTLGRLQAARKRDKLLALVCPQVP